VKPAGERRLHQLQFVGNARWDVSIRQASPKSIVERHLGSLEAEVMRVLWARPDSSVRDVAEALKGRKRAYTTVMTVMSRLYEKGLLIRSPVGRAYSYSPAVTEEEFLNQVSSRMIRSLLQEFGEVAISQFIGELRQLRPEEMARLRQVLGDQK
jgi:predicted transcriptional regulator